MHSKSILLLVVDAAAFSSRWFASCSFYVVTSRAKRNETNTNVTATRHIGFHFNCVHSCKNNEKRLKKRNKSHNPFS